MSAGYLVMTKSDEKLKDALVEQQKESDESYRVFAAYAQDKAKMKQRLNALLHYKNEKFERAVIRLFYEIQEIRNRVFSRSITFEDEISYYSEIDRNLLNLMYVLLSHFDKRYGNLIDIYKLEELKEIEGLERAYVYNYLLSKNRKLIAKIRELFIEEKKFANEYFSDASLENVLLYNQIVKRESQQRVKMFEKEMLKGNLSNKDAAKWFEISTNRINELEKLSIHILKKYHTRVYRIYETQKKALY